MVGSSERHIRMASFCEKYFIGSGLLGPLVLNFEPLKHGRIDLRDDDAAVLRPKKCKHLFFLVPRPTEDGFVFSSLVLNVDAMVSSAAVPNDAEDDEQLAIIIFFIESAISHSDKHVVFSKIKFAMCSKKTSLAIQTFLKRFIFFVRDKKITILVYFFITLPSKICSHIYN
jgi:hypothetical protein